MYCMKCGHELEDGARFCTECGAPQDVFSAEETQQKTSTPRRPSGMQIIAVLVAAFVVMAVGAFAFICLSSTLPLQPQSAQSQDAAGAGTTGSATGSGSAAGSGGAAQKPISDQGDALAAAQGDVTVGSGELTYANDRYGYKVTLPASFELVAASDNGDGATFREPSTGVEVRVWGSANALGETLDSVLDSYTSAYDVAYKATGGTWVVASWVDDGHEYYAKQYVGEDNINGIQFSYPQSSSDAGSAVIEAYIDEFVPGDL